MRTKTLLIIAALVLLLPSAAALKVEKVIVGAAVPWPITTDITDNPQEAGVSVAHINEAGIALKNENSKFILAIFETGSPVSPSQLLGPGQSVNLDSNVVITITIVYPNERYIRGNPRTGYYFKFD